MPTFVRPIPFLAALAFATLASTAWADDCRHSEPRSLDEDLASADLVVIEARAGKLEVVGVDGDIVRADGKACASSRRLLEAIDLRAERAGGTLRIVVDTPDTGWRGSARLGLRVDVPRDVAVQIFDSSGDIVARDLRLERLDDSSGSARLSNLDASLIEISDSSGDLDVRDVEGSLRLADSSGSIRVENVSGSVIVTDDSSGDIVLRRIGGDAVVENDSSGGIVAEDVAGDFRVLNDGSGGIRHADVSGRVELPADD
ncbi:MAG: DUF4097 family beta strand repeat-containing protein [Acidobacteriota bacterium]